MLHVGSFTRAARLLRTSRALDFPAVGRNCRSAWASPFSRGPMDAAGRRLKHWPCTMRSSAASASGLERIAERAAQIKDQRVEQLRIDQHAALTTSSSGGARSLLEGAPRWRGRPALQVQRSSVASWVSTGAANSTSASRCCRWRSRGSNRTVRSGDRGFCVMLPTIRLRLAGTILRETCTGWPSSEKGRDNFAHLPLQRRSGCRLHAGHSRRPPIASSRDWSPMASRVTITDRFTAVPLLREASSGAVSRRIVLLVRRAVSSHSQRTELVEAFATFCEAA